MTDLHIIVLAAGQGTRMKSATPKVLHHVAHQPMLAHVLAVASDCGAASVTGVVSPNMPALETAFAGHGIAVQQVAQGTGDAVKAALPVIPADATGIAVVVYADTPLVRQETIEALAAPIREGNAAVTFFAMRVAEPGAYGRMVTNGAGELLRIVEAKEADAETLAINLCNGGFCAFDLAKGRALVEQIDNQNNKGEYYLTDLVEIARDAGHGAMAVEGDPTDAMGVNDRADLAKVEAVMQDRLRARHLVNGVTMTAPETVFLATDTSLAPDTIVEPHVVFGPGVNVTGAATIRAFSHLEGCEIGAGATIGPYARIRPGSSIGAQARVGNFVETKNVKMGEGAKANHLTYLGDATIGPDANVGAGTITCNYDGFSKSRTEIGRNAFIGSNSALVAPVKVGDGAIIGAGSTITNDVDADAIAVARGTQVDNPGRAATFREMRAAEKAKKAAKKDS